MQDPRIILLAHDKPEKLAQYRQLLCEAESEWRVEVARTGDEAAERALTLDVGVAILDVFMPITGRDAREGRLDQFGGLFALERVAERKPYLPVILFSQKELPDEILDRAMTHRFYDYLVRDEDHFAFKFVNRVRHAEEVCRNRLKKLEAKSEIVFRSGLMERVLLQARRVAENDAPALILGETGTGKSMMAREIHRHSRRRNGPFLVVNSAALPETLVESEMFGHTEGAFTGAARARRGKMEQAHGGTLFLDEVGDMTLATQAKLLRAIEEKEFYPVGGDAPKKVDVRIVCATNKDLEKEIAENRFRDDLYYRICFERVVIPPLRARPEDIVPLAEAFAAEMGAARGRKVTIHPRVFQRVARNELRGNVRELQGIMQAALSRMEPNETEMTEYHLDPAVFSRSVRAPRGLIPEAERVADALRAGDLDLNRMLEQFMYAVIDVALKESGGVGEQAARRLGVNAHTLRRYLRNRPEGL